MTIQERNDAAIALVIARCDVAGCSPAYPCEPCMAIIGALRQSSIHATAAAAEIERLRAPEGTDAAPPLKSDDWNAAELVQEVRDGERKVGAAMQTRYVTEGTDAAPVRCTCGHEIHDPKCPVNIEAYQQVRESFGLARERPQPPTQRDRQQLIDHVGSHVEGETEGAANCETCEYIRNELRQRLVSEPPPARTPDSKE